MYNRTTHSSSLLPLDALFITNFISSSHVERTINNWAYPFLVPRKQDSLHFSFLFFFFYFVDFKERKRERVI